MQKIRKLRWIDTINNTTNSQMKYNNTIFYTRDSLKLALSQLRKKLLRKWANAVINISWLMKVCVMLHRVSVLKLLFKIISRPRMLRTSSFIKRATERILKFRTLWWKAINGIFIKWNSKNGYKGCVWKIVVMWTIFRSLFKFLNYMNI